MDTANHDMTPAASSTTSDGDRWNGYLTFENGPSIERKLTQLLMGQRLAIVNSSQALNRFRPELTVNGVLLPNGVKFSVTPAFDSAVLTIQFWHALLPLHTVIRDIADWHAHPEKHRSTPHLHFGGGQVAITWSSLGDLYYATIAVIQPQDNQ